MTSIHLEHLTKVYGKASQPAVEDVSIEVEKGTLVALLGPSGSGKSTILRMIAGLLSPTRGDVRFDNLSMIGTPPERREAVLVSQDHVLFPHLNVEENIGFGLRMRHVSKRKIEQRVEEMLSLVHLQGYGKRRPWELSGGERQRVALARALIVKPRILLLDEPLANLDAHLRDEMRDLIKMVHNRYELTTIFVTHDRQEAVFLADKIALLFAGALQQFDTPFDLFERPGSRRIAQFFGNMNFLEGIIEGSYCRTEIGCFSVDDSRFGEGDFVTLTIRPEHIRWGRSTNNSLEVEIRKIIYMGTLSRYQFSLGGSRWEMTSNTPPDMAAGEGTSAWITLPSEWIHLLPR